MCSTENRLSGLLLFAIPVAILTGELAASLLAADALASVCKLLTAWTCASVPIGVLVGHCALDQSA